MIFSAANFYVRAHYHGTPVRPEMWLVGYRYSLGDNAAAGVVYRDKSGALVVKNELVQVLAGAPANVRLGAVQRYEASRGRVTV